MQDWFERRKEEDNEINMQAATLFLVLIAAVVFIVVLAVHLIDARNELQKVNDQLSSIIVDNECIKRAGK